VSEKDDDIVINESPDLKNESSNAYNIADESLNRAQDEEYD
jgi:hypothetical protein